MGKDGEEGDQQLNRQNDDEGRGNLLHRTGGPMSWQHSAAVHVTAVVLPLTGKLYCSCVVWCGWMGNGKSVKDTK